MAPTISLHYAQEFERNILTSIPTVSFEQLLKITECLPLPKHNDEREIHWCDDKHVLGFSRQHSGNIELFLRGDELRASSPLVRRHLKFNQWTRSGGEVFRANRLVFPSDDHYTPAAAFLAEELMRRNAAGAMVDSFSQTEPLIEMMLRRTALSDDEILGLLGELRFLEALLIVAVDSKQKILAVDAWRGHERASKDFVYGSQSVEVKSSSGDRSIHRISSVMQVDPRRSESNEPLEELYLLSLGFKSIAASDENKIGISLPSQVEIILQKLAPTSNIHHRSDIEELFLAKVASYGSLGGLGYVHDEMKHWSAYQAQWQQGFLRVYDMSDDAIQVLRRRDVQGRAHVILDSVSFDVDLPDHISGDVNPHNDLFALAKKFLIG